MFRESPSPRTQILGTGSYLPQRVVTNAELEAELQTSDAWIRAHTGIERRHVAAPGETTSDMAVAAGRAAIAAAGLSVADLDMIVLATESPDAPLPATAATVQQKLGADLIPSFDIGASFAGFLYAMTIADQFISAGFAKTILVIGAELLSRLCDPADRTLRPVLGDGAGAVVLGASTGEGRGILSSTIHADGSLAHLCQIPGGGTVAPMTEERFASRLHYMRMEGREMFEVTVRHLTSYSMRALKAAGLVSSELDWVIPQQANRNIVDLISERLGYSRQKFIENLAEVGNTGTASIPIALDQAIRDGRVKPNQNVLLCALGAGITWGAMMVRV